MLKDGFAGGSPETPTGPRRFLMAFEVPAYRWLWLGECWAKTAFILELLTQGWLVLQLTDSPFWVGVSAGVMGVGHFLFSIVGGVWTDRIDRRKLLMAVRLVEALRVFALAMLILTGAVQLWHILCLVALVGVTLSVNIPVSTALTYDLVGRRRLLNASAFRFLAGSLSRIFGALVGGFIIDRLGPGENYLLALAAYLLALASLLFFRSPANSTMGGESLLQAVKVGVHYVLRTPLLRRLLVLSLLTEVFGFSYMHMMPVMARDVLGMGATGLGYLTAMTGVGQLVAMLVLASLGDFRNKGWLLIGSSFGFGLFIMLFGLSPWFLLSLSLVAIIGGMGSIYDSTIATVMQIVTSDQMRGRVLGIYVSTFGLNQVGAFGLGGIGSLVGIPIALVISGGVAGANALRQVGIAYLVNSLGHGGADSSRQSR